MFQNHLTRRRFLHAAGGVAAAGLLGPAFGRCDATAAEKPRLRFVQWNDTHVDSHTPSDYRLANEKMKYLVDSLNAATYFPRPDFVVGVGDLITGEALSKLASDFALLNTMLAGLKCPFYPVMGNHEVV
jgi:predicted MPP superfamily phosphohydrolase